MKLIFILFFVVLLSHFKNAILVCSSNFCGPTHQCVVTSTNQLKCFGRNNVGQLGLGNTDHKGDNPSEMGDYLPFANILGSQISSFGAISWHCSQTASLNVFCWGANDYGQLGQGDTTQRGSGSMELGVYLPPVPFSASFIVSQFDLGDLHGLILTDSQMVQGWGRDNVGQLGSGGSDHKGDAPSEMGEYLPFIQVDSLPTAPISQISSGGDSNCVLMEGDGSMRCWGYNGFGQLGVGHSNNIGDGGSEMGSYLQSVNLPSSISSISQIVSGKSMNGFISESGTLFVFGLNGFGYLGLGHAADIGNNPNEMGEYLQPTLFGSGRTALEVKGLLSFLSSIFNVTICFFFQYF